MLLLHELSKVSNVIRRINTPPPPVVSRMHRANGINPDKPTRINPQTKRKRAIYKIYRYTLMVYICVYCTYAVCVCVSLNETTVAPDARDDRPSKFYYHMRILYYYICTRFVYKIERNKTAKRAISFFGKPTLCEYNNLRSERTAIPTYYNTLMPIIYSSYLSKDRCKLLVIVLS